MPCTNCEAYFPTEYKLREHIESEHEIKPHFDVIETKFDATLLEETEAGVDDEIKGPMKFNCRLCQAQMKNMNEFKIHMAHHSKLKSLLKLKQKKTKTSERKGKFFKNQCKICAKKFKKPSQLTRHERIHTGDKPFVVSNEL